ncbi:hypothetical protein [Nostoc sp. WHI]|uniref:hypothetical protein n=1 Tax=Nostoc sp. WHI TaxID=2650611 RepID=UPI0018C4C70F|nr:hypothetical protein [Nostoc sp. WHI]
MGIGHGQEDLGTRRIGDKGKDLFQVLTEEAEEQFLLGAGGASPGLEPWSGAEHGYVRGAFRRKAPP